MNQSRVASAKLNRRLATKLYEFKKRLKRKKLRHSVINSVAYINQKLIKKLENLQLTL